MTRPACPPPWLSIIVPVLDEAAGIVAALEALRAFRLGGAELIVVDGGSADATLALATPLADQAVTAPRGRAAQMNRGAALANGAVLLFLHADTGLPADAAAAIGAAIGRGHAWGRFDVRIEGGSPLFPVVGRLMNLRSRLTGIATGDQAIFAARGAFEATGGFPELPLMEDIAFSRRMRRIGAPACLRQKVGTSGRRWEKHGVLRTIGLMWWLRLRFFLGGDPARLAVEYGYRPR